MSTCKFSDVHILNLTVSFFALRNFEVTSNTCNVIIIHYTIGSDLASTSISARCGLISHCRSVYAASVLAMGQATGEQRIANTLRLATIAL